MNKDTPGILELFIIASPAIGLALIFVILAYRKFKQGKEAIRNERQLEKLAVQGQSASTSRKLFSFLLVTALLLINGLVIGITVAFIGSFFYIVFAFPLLMGIAAGRALTGAVHLARIRKFNQLLFLSLFTTAIIYGTYHYGRYIGLQVQTSLQMFSGLSKATEEKSLKVANAVVDYALKEETGRTGFVGYMLLKAREGVSIGRFYHQNSTNLGPILTWFYWLLEFGLILWAMLTTGKKQIAMPFCESCGNWYSGERHLGGTARANESLLLNLIKQKDFDELRKLLQENAELPSLEVYLQGCEKCNGSNSRLVVRRAFQSTKGGLQFKEASQMPLQPSDSALLLNQGKLV